MVDPDLDAVGSLPVLLFLRLSNSEFGEFSLPPLRRTDFRLAQLCRYHVLDAPVLSVVGVAVAVEIEVGIGREVHALQVQEHPQVMVADHEIHQPGGHQFLRALEDGQSARSAVDQIAAVVEEDAAAEVIEANAVAGELFGQRTVRVQRRDFCQSLGIAHRTQRMQQQGIELVDGAVGIGQRDDGRQASDFGGLVFFQDAQQLASHRLFLRRGQGGPFVRLVDQRSWLGDGGGTCNCGFRERRFRQAGGEKHCTR